MHKYLRAIGFSKVEKRDQLQLLLAKTIKDPIYKSVTTYDDNTVLGEYCCDFGENFGLCVCGEINEKDEFIYEYYYPYLRGSNISSDAYSFVERQAEKLSFAGVCDDSKVGISIIYYLQNRTEYVKESYTHPENVEKAPVKFSGLSVHGTIMMPIEKTEKSEKKVSSNRNKRSKLIEAAKKGDEEAIETLTLDDLDVYSTLSAKIKDWDVYTLVDTTFMPYGVECDQYTVLGEITALKEVCNNLTYESVYVMSLLCNEIPIDICINKADLFGEPKVGRRFKGTIWLQGALDLGSHS